MQISLKPVNKFDGPNYLNSDVDTVQENIYFIW